MSDVEKRSYAGEVRAESRDNEPTHIIGYGSVFNTMSEVMWGFREIIMPGAFDDVLEDDVRGLFNQLMILALNTTLLHQIIQLFEI